MLWIKIKKDDLTFTEGSWTLSNAHLKAVGSFREDSSYPNTQRNAVVRNGYLYVLGYDDDGVYKINVSNSTDVTFISLGDLFFRTHRCYIVNLEKVMAYSANSVQVLNGDSIMLAEKKYTDFVKTYLRYAKNGGIVNV